MRSLYVRLVGYFEELSVLREHELHVFIAEGDHCPVVQDQVIQKGVRLLLRVVDSCLVELELGHSKTSDDHKRRRQSDHDGDLPRENKAESAREEDSQEGFSHDSDTFCCEPVHLLYVFTYDIAKVGRCVLLLIVPTDVF